MAAEHGNQPTWAVAPGEVLAEELVACEMSQSELARRMDRPVKTINEIVNARTALTPETAIQLERALGVSAGVWSGLERNYRDALARQHAEADLASYASWASEFPIKDLVRQKLIAKSSDSAQSAEALLKYFQVSSVSAWERLWGEPVAAFRQSPSHDASSKAVAAWLRWGQQQAEQESVASFERSTFLSVVEALPSLTTEEPFSETLRDLKEDFAEAGVVFLVLTDFTGTRLSGATHWAGSTPVVQLSLRHRRDDQFWFTLLHECRHVIQGRQRTFVDLEHPPVEEQHRSEGEGTDGDGVRDDRGERGDQDVSQADEQDADQFARETLVPSASLEALTEPITSASVRELADSLGVAPGIVVGRLQRDGQLKPSSSLNALKRSLRWA